MNKNLILGTGILGIVAAAAYYIYEECQKKKQETVIYIENDDVSAEPEQNEQEDDKKAATTSKISGVFHKIGKTVGTTFLKIGSKYPKVIKGICKAAKFWPLLLLAGCAVIAAFNKKPRWPEPEETETVTETLSPWEANWDEKYRENYNRVTEFAKTLNLEEGECYIIEDQKQYIEDGCYPTMDVTMPIVSHMIFGTGAYPPEDDQ